MSRNTSSHWLTLLLLIAGLLAFPAMVRADDEHEIKFDDLPRHVRDALTEGHHEHVMNVWEVRRGDRTFYRAVVEVHDRPVFLRIDRDGHVMSDSDMPPVERDWESQWVHQREGEQVQMDDLPRRVRHTLEDQARDHRVTEIYRLRTEHHSFYRAIIDMRDGQKVVRIGEDGDLLSADTLPDWERGWEGRWHGTRLGDPVRMEDVPPVVHRAIDREIGHEEVREVRKYDMGGLPVYQVVTNGHQPRVIEVLPTGIVLGEGEQVRNELHSIRFEDLPREARENIREQAGRAQIENVFVGHRRGEPIYIGVAAGHEGVQTYIITDEHGHLISTEVR